MRRVLEELRFELPIQSFSEIEGPGPSACAPAHAASLLAEEELG